MNIYFSRESKISIVSITSNVYWTYALGDYDLCPRSCVLSTNKGLVNDPAVNPT